MKVLAFVFIAALQTAACASQLSRVQTVFVIVLENHNWSGFHNATNALFINNVLLPMASHCEQYYNPPGLHPSLPNYIWLEAGTNCGIFDDNDPSVDHQPTTNHLSSLLNRSGISWRAYQEDIAAGYVPLANTNGYAVRHNPFVYFDDVTGTNNPGDPYGIAHIRPYNDLATDLTNNTVARYNFITPNICHGGHDSCGPTCDPFRQSDDWLAAEVPKILNSAAFSNSGAVFITWDEGENASDGPIGMIVLSPLARGGGYSNEIRYTHSSLLRTLQEIFCVRPYLGDAANAMDLADLFMRYELTECIRLTNGHFQITVSGAAFGKTNVVQTSTDMLTWIPISTNTVATNCFTVLDTCATNFGRRFYRSVELR